MPSQELRRHDSKERSSSDIVDRFLTIKICFSMSLNDLGRDWAVNSYKSDQCKNRTIPKLSAWVSSGWTLSRSVIV